MLHWPCHDRENLTLLHANITKAQTSLTSSQSDQCLWYSLSQGSHRLEKYLDLEGLLEKTLKIKSASKSTVENYSKALKSP